MENAAMKVMVTGSSGLIGRWICKLLQHRDIEVIGLDKRIKPDEQRWLNFYQCDILDRQNLARVIKEAGPQKIIHLAARVDLDEGAKLDDYDANIGGVKNIIDCARDTSSVNRLIITSSQLVCRVGYVPKSDIDYCPDTRYGESKVLTEKITRTLDGGGKTWCLVRPTTVWGPGMSLHYQKMLDLICRGHYFHCGNNKLYKSYAYAGNIAFQYYKLLEAEEGMVHGKTLYLADYRPISLKDYADDLARALGAPPIKTLPLVIARALAYTGNALNAFGFKSFPFNSFRLRNILSEYRFDLTETGKICGDLPFTYAEGVAETAKWYLALKRL